MAGNVASVHKANHKRVTWKFRRAREIWVTHIWTVIRVRSVDGDVMVARCFASRQICLIRCTGHNHVTGELLRNNVWAPKVGSGGCTKPTFFFVYGELGYRYREVSFDTYVFLDITYWNYNTLFQVKVSLILLQRDPDLMVAQTKRPNLTNCVGCMIYWHWVRLLSNQKILGL